MKKNNKETKKRSSKNKTVVTKVVIHGYRVSIHNHPTKKHIGINVIAPMKQAANKDLMCGVVNRCLKYLVDEGFLPSRAEATEQGLNVQVNAWGNK
jgi:hypothetical protein